MQQMLRTIRLLHDMQASNRELREARLLNDTVREHLSIVGAPLPDVEEPRLPALEYAAGTPAGAERKPVPNLTEATPPRRVPQRVARGTEEYETDLHTPDQGIGRLQMNHDTPDGAEGLFRPQLQAAMAVAGRLGEVLARQRAEQNEQMLRAEEAQRKQLQERFEAERAVMRTQLGAVH